MLRTLPRVFAIPAVLALTAAVPADRAYVVRYLVSDGPAEAAHVDGNLVNGWGIAAGATSPWWVSDNGTSLSTLYNGDGVASSLVVSIPTPPTGIVAYAGTGFVVTDGTASGPARFLFASPAGVISGWNPAVPAPAPSTVAHVVVDNSASGAVYTGLALATTAEGDFLYAADFLHARVDVFDSHFAPVVRPGAFVDRGIPAGYSPFGIQNVNGRIVVAYARQNEDGDEEVAGQGLGYVSVFQPSGAFVARVATRGLLNAPWGIALAPSNFGSFGGDLLVGNFGDGRISAFAMTSDMRRFTPRGQLRGADGKPITIDGLWGIGFGNGTGSGPTNALYFAAGPDDELHGTFGRIDPAP